MEKARFVTNGKIWLEIDGEKVLGPGRVELMERIHASGSVRQAALQMDMAYRQAWYMIKQMNAHFTEPVVTLSRGGKGGGKATVSSYGLELITEFHALRSEFKDFLNSHRVSGQ